MYEELFENNKVVPVVVLKNVEDTLPTLQAMQRGGINVAEITFRTDCAADAIKLGRKELPDMFIGAGTVINGEQCERAIACGAQFIVGPGLSEEVADVCKKHDVPYLPGCVTPTEIMKALSLGYNIIKFFPAGVFGGLKALKALSGSFPSGQVPSYGRRGSFKPQRISRIRQDSRRGRQLDDEGRYRKELPRYHRTFKRFE